MAKSLQNFADNLTECGGNVLCESSTSGGKKLFRVGGEFFKVSKMTPSLIRGGG